MRIMIRQQAPGFIFTPNHRISPRLSGKQPKSIDCHQLETGEVYMYEYSTCLKISFLTWRNYGRKLSPHFPSFKIIFHLPPLKLIAHSDNVKH